MSRKKTPRGTYIYILNTPLDKLGISIGLLSTLKTLELNNLAETRKLWEEDRKEFEKTFGKTTLQELRRIFSKNNIPITSIKIK